MALLPLLWGVISFSPALGAALAIGLLSGHAAMASFFCLRQMASVFVSNNETRSPDQVYADWLRKHGMRGV